MLGKDIAKLSSLDRSSIRVCRSSISVTDGAPSDCELESWEIESKLLSTLACSKEILGMDPSVPS